MSPVLLFMVVVALASLIGTLVATVILQDKTIAALKKALDTTSRAESRQRAAAEILRADLLHLSHSAQVITLWRPRQPDVSRKETP